MAILSQSLQRLQRAETPAATNGPASPPTLLKVASVALSAALVAVVAYELAELDWRDTIGLVPLSAPFWLAFAGFYLAGPIADWVIFRRLWRLPLADFPALLRKMIYNELVLGYLGEAWFYTWSRKRPELVAAPFGAVKDVAILSALAGNLVTLALIMALWPLVRETIIGEGTRTLVLALAPVVLISLGVLLFGRRVFSLDRAALAFVTGVHLLRIVGRNALLALVWHLALPAVPVVWWLYLATLRLLISRLPLVANKDAIFAGLALLVLGKELDLVALMAMTAGLLLAINLIVAAALVLSDFASRRRT